jgi:hypothetical protein
MNKIRTRLRLHYYNIEHHLETRTQPEIKFYIMKRKYCTVSVENICLSMFYNYTTGTIKCLGY